MKTISNNTCKDLINNLPWLIEIASKNIKSNDLKSLNKIRLLKRAVIILKDQK